LGGHLKKMHAVLYLFFLLWVVTGQQFDLTKALQDVAQYESEKYNCSVIVAVKSKDFEFAVSRGTSNFETGRLASVDDKVIWGSNTKPFTGYILLTLADKGIIKLTDKIVDWINPFFKRMKHHHPEMTFSTLEDIYGLNITMVTINDLATMTLGVADFDTDENGMDPSRAVFYAQPDKYYSPLDILLTFDYAYEMSEHYSSTNFILLGFIIAAATGKETWEEFHQAEYLPADVYVDFGTGLPPSAYTQMIGYDRTSFNNHTGSTDIMNVKSDFSGWTASDMVASPLEAAKLMWNVFGPESILSPASKQRMRQRTNSNFYHFASMNMSFLTGQTNPSYADAVGHMGSTYGYQTAISFSEHFEFQLTTATNIETDHQVQPIDTMCLAYGAMVDYFTNKSLGHCSFEIVEGHFPACKCVDE